MPVRVYLEPFEGRFKATCEQFDLAVIADTKDQANERMHELIRDKVNQMTGGDIPKSSGPKSSRPAPTCAASGKRGGCSGCGH